MLLFAADDHDREVKSRGLDELREITVHFDMEAEVLKHRDVPLKPLSGGGVKVYLRDWQDGLSQFLEDHDLIDDFLEVISDKENFGIIFLLCHKVTIADNLALHA